MIPEERGNPPVSDQSTNPAFGHLHRRFRLGASLLSTLACRDFRSRRAFRNAAEFGPGSSTPSRSQIGLGNTPRGNPALFAQPKERGFAAPVENWSSPVGQWLTPPKTSVDLPTFRSKGALPLPRY